MVDPGEECDDGNDNDSDACTRLCQPAFCGDGLRQRVIGEQCDDGNSAAGDGCDPNCQREGEGCMIAIVDDTGSAMFGVGTLLEGEAFDVELLDNTSAIYTSNPGELDAYEIVVFNEYNRALSQQEHDILNAYVESGGRLILTGYDTAGSPTDPLTAQVCRTNTNGDGPFQGNIVVTNDTHPALDGPYGTFANGTTFTVYNTDHDSVTADPSLGSVELLQVGNAAKLTYATNQGQGGGTVYYWNGNASMQDWTDPGIPQQIFLNLITDECY